MLAKRPTKSPAGPSLLQRALAMAVLVTAATLCGFGCTGEPAAPPSANAGAIATCSSASDCAIFDDGDPCTGTWACVAGSCALDPATVVHCDSSGDSLCAVNTCVASPAAGGSGAARSGATALATCKLLPRNLGAACEDGDPCTAGDACKDGVCAPGATSLCQCSDNNDCSNFEDDNPCTGTLFCRKTSFPYRCVTNPITVVTCPDDTACQSQACDPKTGSCVASPRPDKTACDDGDTCTQTDVCLKGKCVGGDNSCTCSTDADCKPLDLGDLCKGVHFCDKTSGTCKLNASTVVTCPTVDDTACKKRVCQPSSGLCLLQAVNPGGACNDGDPCTKGEVCQGGLCTGGTDTCSCGSDADCAKLEDGNACNGTLYCNLASGACVVNPATVVSCPSGGDTACRVNACDTKTGTCASRPIETTKQVCVTPKKGAGSSSNPGKTEPKASECRYEVALPGAATWTVLCEDGDICTVGDTCAKGSCQAGTSTCVCKVDSDCAKQEDGDLCNGTLYCDKPTATCKLNPATVVTCPTVDDTACRKRTCDPKTGKCPLQPLKNGLICEDGNACTKGDACVFGQCNPGTNVCECQTNSDCLVKDDGNLCNGVPYCDRSNPKKPTCKANPASVVVCAASQTPCAVSTCNPSTGNCQPVPSNDGKVCKDGTACTKPSTCKGGSCNLGPSLSCDDKNPCTTDSCDPKKGCQHVQSVCDDGNSCTSDVCDPATLKCSFPPRASGTTCDADQSGCTVGDVCQSGVCTAGPKVVCQLNAKACEQAICQSKGATGFQCVVATKPDGAACDDGDLCSLSSTCSKGVCAAKPGSEALFSKDYAPPGGLNGRFDSVLALADGGYILGGERWGGSVKAGTWLLRVAADGAVVWERTNTAMFGAGSGGVSAVMQISDKKMMVVRSDVAKAAAYVDVLGINGKKVSISSKLPVKGGTPYVRGGARLADGSVLMTGTRVGTSGSSGFAGRISAYGQVMWLSYLSADKPTIVYGGGAPNGSLVAVGESGAGGEARAWATQLSASGKVQWQLRLPSATSGDRFAAVIRAPREPGTTVVGGLLLVGTRQFKTKARGLLVAVSDSGQVRWTKTSPSPSRFLAAVGVGGVGKPGSAARVVGQALTGASAADLLLNGLDPRGNPTLIKTLVAGSDAAAQAVVARSDDSVAIVGYGRLPTGANATSKLRRGVLWRVGAFGQQSCSAQGVCATKKLADCSDGVACTADGCQAQTGCIHEAASGFSCLPSDGCHLEGTCAGATCKATGRPQLFVRTGVGAVSGPSPVVPRRWTGATALSGGGWLLFGQRADRNALLEKVSAQGDRLWTLTWEELSLLKESPGITARPFASIDGAVATADGGAVVAASRCAKGCSKLADLQVAVRRLSAAGKILWTYTGDGTLLEGIATDLSAIPGTEDVVVVGRRGNTVRVARVAGASPGGGKEVWRYAIYFGNVPALLTEDDRPTVLGHADGGAFVGVTLKPAKTPAVPAPWRTHVRRVNGLGKLLWARDLNQIGATRLSRLVRRADGAVLVVGWIPTPAGDTSRLWLARLKDSGAVAWQRDFRIDLRPNGVALAPDGGLVLLGRRQTAAQTDVFDLAKVGPAGGLWWRRSLTPPGSAALAGISDSVAVGAGGGMVVVGEAKSGALPSTPLLMRLDPWGHASCAEAGGCGKQVAKVSASATPGANPVACHDSDPCTVDRCAPKTGKCVFSPAPEGLACGDAKSCVAGTCTAAPEGMILIPKGTFYMGCNISKESCKSGELPVRKISLPSFWMSRVEVTEAALNACYQAGKCKAKPVYSDKTKDLPANEVRWVDANQFCASLGGRLPSEAEWAYAAKGSCALHTPGSTGADCAAAMPIGYRAPTMSACVWGSKTPSWREAYGCAYGGAKTRRRGGAASGDRSPWGVLDMAGNVREHVYDYYSPAAYKLDFSTFPLGPTDAKSFRGLRGGDYTSLSDVKLGLSRRVGASISTSNVAWGFRCVVPIKTK